MSDIRDLLFHTAGLAAAHLEELDERPVFPQLSADDLRARVADELPEEPIDPQIVVEELATSVAPGLVAIPGGRYFGFVTGSSVPGALAANWLVSAWDQNAGNYVGSPAASIVEDITAGWIKELLGFPSEASVAFVTGTQMAHVTCLAAARQEVLQREGWDVPRRGLWEAPRIRVIAGEKRHVTVDRALRMLGIGTDAIEEVPADDMGRIRTDALAAALANGSGPTIVVAQAGEVNTGSFDPLPEINEIAGHHNACDMIGGVGLLLTTVGRRSGQPRPVIVGYLRDGDDVIVADVNIAKPAVPSWVLNLRAHPEAEVQLGRERYQARAEFLEGEDRAGQWDRQVAAEPLVDQAQQLAGREIAVIRLRRIKGSSE